MVTHYDELLEMFSADKIPQIRSSFTTSLSAGNNILFGSFVQDSKEKWSVESQFQTLTMLDAVICDAIEVQRAQRA